MGIQIKILENIDLKQIPEIGPQRLQNQNPQKTRKFTKHQSSFPVQGKINGSKLCKHLLVWTVIVCKSLSKHKNVFVVF